MRASAVGIDLGSSRTVIAAAIGGGVEILCNEGSFRETPCVVGYGDSQRFLGNEGLTKKKGNYKSTVDFFTRFLGMNGDSEDLAHEKKHVYCPIGLNAENRVVYKPKYQGEQIEILPEQALGSMITKVKDVLELNNIGTKDLVMSVPSYYTQNERKLALMAGKIAGMNIVRIMNESSSTILNYGIFRKKDLSDEPRLVAFIDVGNAKTSIFFAKVKKTSAEIVMEKTDRNLGGRDFDMLLFQEYAKRFQAKENIDLMEYPKGKMRLIDASEKQRKTLSANADAPINVEYLAEELDFAAMMGREEFETLTAPLFDKFTALVEGAFKESGYTTKEFHSVEVIGGMTRTPKLQETIKNVFKVEDVSRTLNQSESIARGCAIEAAIKSPLFHVSEYAITEKNNTAILCRYDVIKADENGKDEEKVFNNTLFKKNCDYPTNMTISVTKAKSANLQLFYEEAPLHSERILLDISTKAYKIQEKDHKLLLKGKIDDNGIVGLKCCELEENYLEEIKVPLPAEKKPEDVLGVNSAKDIKKPEDKKEEKKDKKEAKKEEKAEEKMDEEPKFKIELKRRTRTTEVKYNSNIKGALDTKQRCEELTAIEGRMGFKDKMIKETLMTKNKLESTIYDARDKLASEWKAFATDIETAGVTDVAQKTEDWLYEEGEDVTKDEYLIKQENLDKQTRPVKLRMEMFLTLRNMLDIATQRFDYFANEIPNNAEKYSHLTPEDQEEILLNISKSREIFEDARQKLQKTTLNVTPPVELTQLQTSLQTCEKACELIFKKPKPAPVVPSIFVDEPAKDEKKMDEENISGKTDQNKTSDENVEANGVTNNDPKEVPQQNPNMDVE